MAQSIKTQRHQAPGFSLLELMIVLAIVAVLTAIALPEYREIQFRAMQTQAQLEVDTIVKEQIAYFAANDHYASLEDLGYTVTYLTAALPSSPSTPTSMLSMTAGPGGGELGGSPYLSSTEPPPDTLEEAAEEIVDPGTFVNRGIQYYRRDVTGGYRTWVAGVFDANATVLQQFIVLSFAESTNNTVFTNPNSNLYFGHLNQGVIEEGSIPSSMIF